MQSIRAYGGKKPIITVFSFLFFFCVEVFFEQFVVCENLLTNMPGRHCCVNGCYNGDNKLKKWRSQLCVIHSCNFGTGRCTCDPPFKLLTFPTESRGGCARSIMIRNINCQSLSRELWVQNNDSRIFSNHFVNLGPTLKNTYPTLHMGHKDIVVGRQPPKDRCLEISTKKRK